MPKWSALLALLLLFAACRSTGAGGGAVAAPEAIAAREGARVLREGGNAFDAAVCVGFVLAVTHPEAGNLGGGGFLVVHGPKGDEVIDARESAPRVSERDMFLDSDGQPVEGASLFGSLAAGVPGSVDGYLLLHERYGTMKRERLLEPAIRLAAEGFEVDEGLHASFVRSRKLLERYESTRRTFLPNGRVPETGEVLRQTELARVLREIARHGREGFYAGWFAQEVEKVCAKEGGVMTLVDLVGYRALLREPLRGSFQGLEVVTMPPPSSGGVVLLQILGMLERGGYQELDLTARRHLFTEASRRAFADRARYFGDPDFVKVPVGPLLDPEYMSRRFETIDMTRATPSNEVEGGLAGTESDETCHFSVVDANGNAVACTTSLNGAYGCGLSVSGVLLNNTMDDFTIKPGEPNQFGLIQGEGNVIEALKRPLSSMTPTILLRDGHPVLVLGSPGGPTIISTVAQVVSNREFLGLDLVDAVDAPRIHCQWLPDEILTEPLPAAEREALEALGHTLRVHKRPLGSVNAIGAGAGGNWIPVTDRRGRGLAIGSGE